MIVYLVGIPAVGGDVLWPSRWLDNLAAWLPDDAIRNADKAVSVTGLVARFPVPGWLPYLVGLAVVVVAIPRLMRAPIGEAAAGALLVGVAVSPHAWGYEAALIAPFIWWAIAGGIAEPWRTRSAIAAYVLAPFWLVSGWTQLSTVAIVVLGAYVVWVGGLWRGDEQSTREPAYWPPSRTSRNHDGKSATAGAKSATASQLGLLEDRAAVGRRRRPSRDPSTTRPRARTTPRNPPIADKGIGRHGLRPEACHQMRGAYSEGG